MTLNVEHQIEILPVINVVNTSCNWKLHKRIWAIIYTVQQRTKTTQGCRHLICSYMCQQPKHLTHYPMCFCS